MEGRYGLIHKGLWAIMRNLNDRQRIVFWVGWLLFVLTFLFPPYRGEVHVNAKIYKCFVAYGFAWSPPDHKDIFRSCFNREWSKEDTSPSSCYAFHILSQCFIQGGVIVLVTLGALAITATREATTEESEAEAKE